MAKHKLFHRVDKVLKHQLVTALDEIFVKSFKKNSTTYANVTSLMLLQHLFTSYGVINEFFLNKNDSTLSADYANSLPIEALWDRVQIAMEFAEDGIISYTNEQVLNIVHGIVKNSGMF